MPKTPAASVEGFDVFNTPGRTTMGRVCNVKGKFDQSYVFSDVRELWMHPNVPEGCTMRWLDYDDGLTKSDLSDCDSSSVLYDPAVVDEVSVQKTMGGNHCVVKIKQGLDDSAYRGYEMRLRDEAVKRSNPYVSLLAAYNKLKEDYDALAKVRDQLKMQIKEEKDALTSELTTYNTEVEKAKLIRSEFAGLDGQISQLSSQAAAIQSKIATANSKAQAIRAAMGGDGGGGGGGGGGTTTDCYKLNNNYVRRHFSEWSDGDRNTAIWLISTITGEDGTKWQMQGNESVYNKLTPLCGSDAGGGGGGKILKSRLGTCVDVEGASKDDYTKLLMWGCHGNANQRFVIDGQRRLVVQHSGKCVDVRAADTQNGADVVQYTCHDDQPHQKFTYRDGTLRPDHAPDMCLNVHANDPSPGARFQLWQCSGGDNEKFDFV